MGWGGVGERNGDSTAVDCSNKTHTNARQKSQGHVQNGRRDFFVTHSVFVLDNENINYREQSLILFQHLLNFWNLLRHPNIYNSGPLQILVRSNLPKTNIKFYEIQN